MDNKENDNNDNKDKDNDNLDEYNDSINFLFYIPDCYKEKQDVNCRGNSEGTSRLCQ